MTTYRIAQLAEHAGLPATTLRYYEREGLLPAARTSSGYRQYTEVDRERVRFIVAAKHLGLPLAQIRELLSVWSGGRCRDVRDELRPRLAAQVAAADERIADLRLFRDRLTAALDHLRDLPAKDGPCEPTCSFLRDRPAERPPVACSLPGGAHQERLDAWRLLLDDAEVAALPDGGRVARVPAARAEALARLVVAEGQCCPFLAFRLDFVGASVELVAHAPAGADALLAALFHRDPAAGRPC